MDMPFSMISMIATIRRAAPAPCAARLLQSLMLGCAMLGAGIAWAEENITVKAVWDGDLVAVTADADLDAGATTAWNVLTDYDHYAEFVKDMNTSRIVSRKPNGMVVEYTGEFRFLFFSRPIHLLLDVVLDPPRRILAHSLSGDLRDLDGIYEISELPQALHISYRARFLPRFSLPPFIGLAVVRHAMELEFTALMREIVRRSALPGANTRGRRRCSVRSSAITGGDVIRGDIADAPPRCRRFELEQQRRGVGDMLLQQFGAKAEHQDIQGAPMRHQQRRCVRIQSVAQACLGARDELGQRFAVGWFVAPVEVRR